MVRAMFDARVRPWIDPPLNAIGRQLARWGVEADWVTWTGFGFGVLACVAIAFGWFWTALILIGCNRLADGLDGAVARATAPTDLGGYLDIVLDFTFYGFVPLAFAVYDPVNNALPAAAVLASYYACGGAFLGRAVMAEKRREETEAQGKKTIYYVAGLAEGAETIAFCVIACVFSAWFVPIAWAWAAFVGAAAVARIIIAVEELSDPPR